MKMPRMTRAQFPLACRLWVQYAEGQQKNKEDGGRNGVANLGGSFRSNYEWAFRRAGLLISG